LQVLVIVRTQFARLYCLDSGYGINSAVPEDVFCVSAEFELGELNVYFLIVRLFTLEPVEVLGDHGIGDFELVAIGAVGVLEVEDHIWELLDGLLEVVSIEYNDSLEVLVGSRLRVKSPD
jgi:hypothetical protein